MAKIPDYAGRTVNIAQIGTPRLSMNAPDASGLTRGLQQAENGIMERVQKEREAADTAALLDADRKLNDWKTSTMFDPEKGVYTRKGQNALDVTNQTLPEFDKHAEQVLAGLNSDQQKDRFRIVAARQRESLSNELNRYEYGELQAWYDQAADSNLKSSAEKATLYYNRPDLMAGALNQGNEVIRATGARKGWTAEKVAQDQKAFTSGIHLATIDRLMTENPSEALTRFASVKGAMTPEDQAKVESVLVPAMQKQQGSAIADQLLGGGNLDYQAYMPALFNQESGGKQFDSNGKPLTSPKGATGIAQVMPATGPEAAKLAGVPWDEERFKTDMAYNACLGEAYCREQFRKFQDPVLALAAYNAGPGRVQQTIDKVGDPRTGAVTHEQFLAALPEETQGYVTNIISKTPQPSAAADGKDRYASALTAIQAMPEGPTRAAAEARIKDFKTAHDAQDAALYEQAANMVASGGINSLTPAMQRQLGGENLGKLVTLDKKLREGVPSTTTPGKLDEFLTMPPTKLGGLSLERDIRPFLSDRDYTTVQSAWQAARKGDGSVQGVAKAENENLNFVMNKADILTGSSKDATKPENLKKQDQFRAAYNARRDAFVSANKREPTLDEARGLSEMLLMDVKLSRNNWRDESLQLWEVNPEDTGRMYVPGDMSIDAVPAADRATIVRELRSNGVQPSEETIIAAYQEKLRANQLEIK